MPEIESMPAVKSSAPKSPRAGQAFMVQMFSFAGVGAIGTAAQYVMLVVFVEAWGFNAVWSSAAGFVVGACINYTLNYYFTFRSDRSHRETAAKFFTIALIGMGLNWTIMHLAVHQFEFHYLASQVAATGVVFFWNFIVNRIWTFKSS